MKEKFVIAIIRLVRSAAFMVSILAPLKALLFASLKRFLIVFHAVWTPILTYIISKRIKLDSRLLELKVADLPNYNFQRSTQACFMHLQRLVL